MKSSNEVRTVADIVEHEFAGNLRGLILYGSAIHGGIRPESDIDLLAVVIDPTSLQVRESLTQALMRVSGRRAQAGPARPAEVTVVVADDLSGNPSEIATDYQYGEWLRDAIDHGAALERHHNPDLVVVLAMARGGISLVGPTPDVLLPRIPRDELNTSMCNATADLLADVEGDERNVVLTIARMQVTLESGEFVPKDVAAERIVPRLPADQGAMLRMAAAAYRGEIVDDWGSLGQTLQDYLNKLHPKN